MIGFAGTGTAFVLLALAESSTALLRAVMLYGLAVSFVDLGANTVGSAYEHISQPEPRSPPAAGTPTGTFSSGHKVQS